MPSRRVVPARGLALGPVEGQRDVRVADERDAEVGRVEAQLRGQAGEHVLPDRVARGGVEEPDSPRRRPDGSSASRNSRVSSEITSCVQRAASAAPREKSSSESTSTTARSWLPARHTVQCASSQRHACVGLGAVADEVAEAPQLLRARPSAAAMTASKAWRCRGCRSRSRPAWRSVYSVPRRLRLPAALVSALVVAEAAVLLLRPKQRYPVVQVETARLLQRGRVGTRHEVPHRTALGSTARGTVARPGCAGRRREARARRHAGAQSQPAPPARPRSRSPARSPALPLRAASRQRAKNVGLITQSWGGWASDVGQGHRDRRRAVRPPAARAGRVGVRRFGRGWWAPGAAAVAGFARRLHLPRPGRARPDLQHASRRCPPATTRDDVLELAEQAPGVEVGEVYAVDASRRTTAANAYVTGIGRTKRVVLYDTLLKDFTPAETRLVVAHELGHVRHRDVAARPAVARARGAVRDARRRARRRAADAGRGATPVPAVALALALLAPAVTHDLQPALARDRAPRRRLRARPHATSRTRWSASSAGSRSRTSATRTRRAGSSSCSARTRPTMERIGQALASKIT